MRKILGLAGALFALGLAGCLNPQPQPELAIATSPHPPVGECPLIVEFRAVHAGGPGVEYLWNFGDGETAPGSVVRHTYAERGTYTAYLTAVTAQGHYQTSVEVRVTSKRPLARFVVFPTDGAQVGQALTFDASDSYDPDPDGAVAEYLWDFGDENWTSTNSPQATHTYRQVGEYTVALVVIDRDGDHSLPATRGVRVLGPCCR